MTAVMLNHMYSSASDASTAEALDTDYLILDWLQANGHCSSEWICLDLSDGSAQMPLGTGADMTRVDWRQDYHNCLLRAMVRALPPVVPGVCRLHNMTALNLHYGRLLQLVW